MPKEYNSQYKNNNTVGLDDSRVGIRVAVEPQSGVFFFLIFFYFYILSRILVRHKRIIHADKCCRKR